MLSKEQITRISSAFSTKDIKNYIRKNIKDYLVYKSNENNLKNKKIIKKNSNKENISKGGATC